MEEDCNICQRISPEEYYAHFSEGVWVKGFKCSPHTIVVDDLLQSYVYDCFLYFVDTDDERVSFSAAYKKCHVDNLSMYGIFYRE